VSLRTRLALFIGVLIALAVLAQGAVGYKRFERLGLEEVDRVLRDYTLNVSRFALGGRGNGDHKDLGGGPRNDNLGRPPRGDLGNLEAANPSLRARVIENNVTTRVFGEAFPSDLGVVSNGFQTLGEWRVAALTTPDGVRFEAAVNLRDQQRGVQNYLQSVLLTVPLFASLGALAAWLFSAAALQPLEIMIRTTRHVAESGDLTQRVPQRSGKGELERLGQTFNQMLERLQGFREREVGFTRTAAHEFRTPLTAMRAQLDAQAQGWATADEALNTAREQVERMTKLSQALLMLAREGRAELSQLDLAALAQRVARERDVSYSGLAHFHYLGNAILLERAMDNLLENASKHAPNAGVKLELDSTPQLVILAVTDSGPGIQAAALERVHEAFYRAPGTKAYGSGLGLAVVQSICAAHGGSLKLENVEPHGLRVRLELPLEAKV
jgi:signal transduction histidine kinase